jgi:A/G-specific adenine glycosylase
MDARATIPHVLLGWYTRHARSLPWRVPPGSGERPDPYCVWLSEVMLQQTTVAAVKPYFESFTARWPTVEALAAADEADVMAAWAGLGYYSRARNLVKCAREVAARGGFPESEEELRLLPGLGAYTAAAVAAIAFGRRAVVIDANVERVAARLFAIDAPLPAGKAAIRAAADSITPGEGAGHFAQAMMDLGATICSARDPKCLLCPLEALCEGRMGGDPARFPVKPAKKAKPERTGTAFWIELGGKVWLVRRAASGMLGGMRALPDDGWNARADGSGEPPVVGQWREAGGVRHSFTHFHLTLSLRATKASEVPGEGEWWPIAKLDQAGLPTVFAKAARLALA